MSRSTVIKLSCLAMSWHLAIVPVSAMTLTLPTAETAQIDGRDWERTGVGGSTMDAVHRAVLIRFPGSAAQIKAALDQGMDIERAEITLEFANSETNPPGYTLRHGLGVQQWQSNLPRWHVIAHALRQPWAAHATFGPTSRYRVRLISPWSDVNAANSQTDRFAQIYGPAELSHSARTARIDITAALTTGAIEESLGPRLRMIEQNGFILHKLETYDMRYRPPGEIYEWAIPTGGHGLVFQKPALVLTFRTASKTQPLVTLPSPTDVAGLAERTDRDKLRRVPDMLPSAELQTIARGFYQNRPQWMSEQQFKHVGNLFRAGGDTHTRWLFDLTYADLGKYRAFLRETLATPPRYWKGWGIADDLMLVNQLGALVPRHVRQHLEQYWQSYLMPDMPTSAFHVPHSREAGDYWQQTGDWRGRTSFFRGGYNYSGSTQNFNFTAAMGALLGGAMIGSEAAMADGRHGIEHLLLRYWTLKDGSTQEMLDHYYLSITLSAVKMLADHAPAAFDRLAARIITERTMEMLTTIYHPALRRMIGASGRARISGVLTEQDGIYGALHVLSERGVLLYPDRPSDAKVNGLPVWGYDFPPGRVALQSLTSPWAPAWFSEVIDNKPLPFSEHATQAVRGHFNPPLRRSSFLARHYGLASQDIGGGLTDILGQWSRTNAAAHGIGDIGTLMAIPCVNICDMVTTRGGGPTRAGSQFTVQDRNRAIVFAKPPTTALSLQESQIGKGDVQTVGSVIGLWMLEQERRWRLFINGVEKMPAELPLPLAPGDILTVQDGPSFVGIRPIPATALDRTEDAMVIVAMGGAGGRPEATQVQLAPTLTIANLNKVSGAPITREDYDRNGYGRQAYGGFVVELGDIETFRDAAAFNAHMQAGSLEIKRSALDRVSVQYRSGNDTLAAEFGTEIQELYVHFPIIPGSQVQAIASRTSNGKAVLPVAGLDRDTTWSQQGTIGRLEKNGVVLETERGRMSYLIADPFERGVLAYNPLPDPTSWRLQLKDGAEIRADGKVGLLRVAIDRQTRKIEVDHERSPTQSGTALARQFTVRGFGPDWSVRANDGTVIVRR